MEKELLLKTNIPVEYHDFCFIKDGVVYPPLIENGKIVKTGEERYNDKFNRTQVEEKLTLWQKIKKGVGLK